LSKSTLTFINALAYEKYINISLDYIKKSGLNLSTSRASSINEISVYFVWKEPSTISYFKEQV